MASAALSSSAEAQVTASDRIEYVETDGVLWCVRRCGRGPVVLLLHGMGASKHSFETLIPLLQHHFTVIAPDLPGHGDSELHRRSVMSLNGMARETSRLLRAMKLSPPLIVGHSAGAALATRMVLDGHVNPTGVVSINGAFVTYGGAVGRLLAPIAGLCSASRLVTDALARKARDVRAVERVIASTGSTLDGEALSRYSEVLQKPSHMAATFAMMANWDLESLRQDLRKLSVPLELLVAERDGAVDPQQAYDVERRCDTATVNMLSGLGHVAHEEDPERLARVISENARQLGVL